MDFVNGSSILGVLRDSAEVLLLGGSESLSLVLWGSALLAVGAGVKALLAPTQRLNFQATSGQRELRLRASVAHREPGLIGHAGSN